jgi:hypothetical protein
VKLGQPLLTQKFPSKSRKPKTQKTQNQKTKVPTSDQKKIVPGLTKRNIPSSGLKKYSQLSHSFFPIMVKLGQTTLTKVVRHGRRIKMGPKMAIPSFI